MPWTITRTDATIRLDLLEDLDEQGRPGKHRVFEYPLDPVDEALYTAKGDLRSDSVVSAEIRRRVRGQLAAEGATTDVVTEPQTVEVAAGDRL